ncbi:helix-turn-helix domain-containing protein [Hahella sp. SMD15-11]|uniref:Helix-turn-helix domain-containing protein n=1 Tax=Thermohahella caldifontis TaxID=3142973 RepID=A0AB39UZS0_9GAMM
MKHKHAMFRHMNQQQLAEYWGISARTLERWRSIGWGPRYIKIGGRVVYRVEDILEYEAEHLYESTRSRSHPTAPGELEETAPSELVPSASLAELPESEWKMISAEVRNGLLSFRIPPEFQATNDGLEYCLVDGELRLRPRKLPLGLAVRMIAGK